MLPTLWYIVQYVHYCPTWSLMMLHMSGTTLLELCAKAWLPMRGAPKV